MHGTAVAVLLIGRVKTLHPACLKGAADQGLKTSQQMKVLSEERQDVGVNQCSRRQIICLMQYSPMGRCSGASLCK